VTSNQQLQIVLLILFGIQGTFVGGTTLLVMARYASDARWRHIAVIALSYLLLTIVTSMTALRDPEVWRLVTLGIAYALGDYAIGVIMRMSKREQPGAAHAQ